MKKRARGAIIAGIVLAVVLVAAVVGYQTLAPARRLAKDNPQTTTATQEAARLADYDATVYDKNDQTTSLTQIANGRPMVINFWATWCPYCVREMPDFAQIVEEYGDRVAFAFVDCVDGSRERVQTTEEWLDENGYADLPVYYDTDREACAAFGARSLPTTVVVSADGQILSAEPGAIDPTLLRATLEQQVRQ